MNAVLPGATVGVIGGGQLGLYFVLEARRMGYRTAVLDPDANAPAMRACDLPVVGGYDDEVGLAQMATLCDAVTTEFENVPSSSLSRLAEQARVAPGAEAVAVAQDRSREKTRAAEHGLTPAPWFPIESTTDITAAARTVAFPAILKTSQLGYDGKGQQVCADEVAVHKAFADFGEVACVLEQRIDLAAEVSVVLARGQDGRCSCFPVAENVHRNGILHTSRVPASCSDELLEAARTLAVQLADGLDYVGVLAVEFLVDTDGQLFFNEMAPRPHNSGHYTLDATDTSQFEQQLRALCGLPLGSTNLRTPVCMVNLLGDLWEPSTPDWPLVLASPGAVLHLYGKSEARAGRKMGHVNYLDEQPQSALQSAERLHQRLSSASGNRTD